MQTMNQILLGTFPLGHINVDLYGLPDDTGGEFYLCPEEGRPPRIKIGLNYPEWQNCVATLLHETLELAMVLRSARFEHTGKLTSDTADFLFVFNHPQFSDLCAMAAAFLTQALPEVEHARRQARKASRKP